MNKVFLNMFKKFDHIQTISPILFQDEELNKQLKKRHILLILGA